MTRFLTSFFYIGLLPKAPGTWGSLAAVPFAVILHMAGGFPLLFGASLAVFFLGWWATSKETAGKAEQDPGEIVIDEVAGQWVTLCPFSAVLWSHNPEMALLPWPGLVAGFILFRIFDILKPWPISWADNLHSPFGVMFDDILAGIIAGVLLLVGGGVAHAWF